MNNIEINLYEIYDEFYYERNIDKLLIYLNDKFERITKKGFKDGLTIDPISEKEIIHKLLLEGLPFYLHELLKIKLKSFEESISEQPMLLAYPNSIKNKNLLNFIEPDYISNLIKNHYVYIDSKIYDMYKLNNKEKNMRYITKSNTNSFF